MFHLRPLVFFGILLFVFRPICGEAEHNATKTTKPGLSPNESKNATTDSTPKTPPRNIVISENGSVKLENKTQSENTTQKEVTKPVIELITTHADNTTETNTSNTHVTVGRKGVDDQINAIKSNTTSSTTEKSTTVSTRPKKPTVTIGSDDESQIDQKSKNSSTGKLPNLEYYQRHKEQINKADFVIPIVAVILSVPVVAIVINILYKRGKEWWSHRHYRRMDFLIDGMYNN